MKAIVVRQPWATLIALGVKTIETRPGPPNGPMRPDGVRGLPGCTLVRGERVAIVAGKGRPTLGPIGTRRVMRSLGHPLGRESEFMVGTVDTSMWSPLPLGAVVCTVTVDDALPVLSSAGAEAADTHHIEIGPEFVAMWRNHKATDDPYSGIGWKCVDVWDQLPLGDFTPGRWGWLLGDVQPCAPVPCKGRQGVFVLSDDVAEKIG